MITFKQYLLEATANTVLSDINEIHVGFVLNGNKWYSQEAKSAYEARIKQAQPDERRIQDSGRKVTVGQTTGEFMGKTDGN
jgi:hypothetical protein